MRGRALGPGSLRKRGRSWVLHYTDEDGQRRSKVVGKDRRTAEQARAAIIRKRDLSRLGLGDEAGQERTLDEILVGYLADLEPRVSDRHFKNVRQRLTWTVEQLPHRRICDLTVADLTGVRARVTAEGRSNRTANLVLDRLRAMLNWAVDAGLVAANPVPRLKRLPETAGHRRYKRRAMTEEEIARFLLAAEQDDEQCALLWDYQRVPQRPVWQAFLETGARYRELTSTTWGDFDPGRRLLTLRAETTKSDKQRVIPLRDELVDRLRALRALHESVLFRLPNVGDRIFLSPEGRPWSWATTNLMRIFDRLLVAAGIPKLDAQGKKLDIHALRTTAASRFARVGAPLVQTQHILGHSDPKLTAAVYTDLSAEDLRGAVEALPPTDRVPAKRRAGGER